MENVSKPPLRLVHLESPRARFLERIRRAEGDRVIRDIENASTDELRLIAAWLDSGRMCEKRPGPVRGHAAEGRRGFAALDPPRVAFRTPHAEKRARLMALREIYRSPRFASTLTLRQRTLKSRLLLTQERMLFLMSSYHSHDSVRKFVRWNRLALRLMELMRNERTDHFTSITHDFPLRVS
jgi:hypothetical protein